MLFGNAAGNLAVGLLYTIHNIPPAGNIVATKTIIIISGLVPVAYHLLHISCKTSKNKGLGMNAKIEKTINGRAISANPVFKGGMRPAYWSCAINNRIIDKIFGSASEVFRFAEKIKQH